MRVWEDGHFLVETADYCAIPGYLILRCHRAATSASDFTEAEAAAYGPLYARVVRAIEAAAGADRVYTLVFAEADRRFHVHLFPRTRWMLLDYWKHHGECQAGPANGPLLFEWARTTYLKPENLPAAAPTPAQVAEALRQALAGTTDGVCPPIDADQR